MKYLVVKTKWCTDGNTMNNIYYGTTDLNKAYNLMESYYADSKRGINLSSACFCEWEVRL